MKTTLNTLALSLLTLSTAQAASGVDTEGNGILVWIFIGFGALILVFQLVPGLMLFFSMVKGLFSKAPKEVAISGEDGEAK